MISRIVIHNSDGEVNDQLEDSNFYPVEECFESESLIELIDSLNSDDALFVYSPHYGFLPESHLVLKPDNANKIDVRKRNRLAFKFADKNALIEHLSKLIDTDIGLNQEIKFELSGKFPAPFKRLIG